MANKQADLPGMENREIKELQEAAVEYAEIRDRRIQLQSGPNGEAALKQNLLKLMEKHRLEKYKYEDVEILVVHEAATVKVKIKSKDSESPEE